MKIFISYRRAEDNKSYIVGTIHEKLEKVFQGEVFRDTYDIAGGTDWRNVLEHELNDCRVMLVIIGPDWASLQNANGAKRLFDPQDVTRWEVETGLRRRKEVGITLIPVFVTGAQVPKTEDLPDSLHELLAVQGVNLRNFPDFEVDMERLIKSINTALAGIVDIRRKYFEPETIYIPGGKFWMGSEPGVGIRDYETPRHEVNLAAYRMGKYPVTNQEYEEYIRQTGKSAAREMNWYGQRVPTGEEKLPVAGVSWDDAIDYCKWLSDQTGKVYGLPNEAQFEKACRGGRDCLFPWGDEFDPNRCNQGHPNRAAVDTYPAQNDYGGFDFVGNVRQWTCTLWGVNRTAPDVKYAYPWKDDGRNELTAPASIRRVVRGSSMKDEVDVLRCSTRRGEFTKERGLPGTRHGFRVALLIQS